ncbi:MAG TPA: baseplate J/gp47 family protein [Thermoanaerobaculia bacterium]
MSFRRRPFPEVLDNLLSQIAGGVAGEEHPFPPPGAAAAPFRHGLQRPPVAELVSVYGSRDAQPRLFRRDKDYKLLPDQQTVEWLEGAELPDPGTLISVSYFPASAQPVLTDLQTGSVIRTLSESIGLEIARLYAQLEAVYQAGFVDTATGSSLDNVVALLGVERVEGGRAQGEVEFRRVEGTRGAISIPAGTRVMTADGNVEYETVTSVTMSDGQSVIRAVARDLEANDPLPADSLTVLPVPIAGIATVTNPAPTAIATESETDEDLRERAKNFLHGSERATPGALRQAVARQQITADVEEDPARPGTVKITPHAEAMPPELQQRLLRAIEDARPAGVRVELVGFQPPARVDLELRLTTKKGLTEPDLLAAQRAVREKVEDYFRKLPAKDPGSVNQIVGLVLSVPQVDDVRIVSATVGGASVLDLANGQLAIGGTPTVLGELYIADPNLPTRVSAVVTFAQGTVPPPDKVKIGADLTNAFAGLNSLNEQGPGGGVVLSYDDLLQIVTGGAQPYELRLAVTLQSGVTQILEKAGDEYDLTPFERLEFAGVDLQEEPADG